MLYTKFIIDRHYDCDYCKINDDKNEINIDCDTNLVKFIISSDIKELDIIFFVRGDKSSTKTIKIYIDKISYNYKVYIKLDKLLDVYYY